jgi:hypothetical protein
VLLYYTKLTYSPYIAKDSINNILLLSVLVATIGPPSLAIVLVATIGPLVFVLVATIEP